MRLGHRIWKARQDQQMSPERLRKLAGISGADLMAIERCRHVPTDEVIRQLADALRLDPKEWLEAAALERTKK